VKRVRSQSKKDQSHIELLRVDIATPASSPDLEIQRLPGILGYVVYRDIGPPEQREYKGLSRCIRIPWRVGWSVDGHYSNQLSRCSR
jgi:hypothetical protein